MKILVILLVVGLAGCGPTGKIKRAQRLIALAEAQGVTWKTDTVWVKRSVIVPEVHFDTVVQVKSFIDTVIVTKDKVITKVKVNTLTKEVFVSTDCPGDTVVIRVPTIINREISAKGYTGWGLAWRCVVFLLIGVVIGYILKIFL